jgi:phosphoesterase RecJ-like protein
MLRESDASVYDLDGVAEFLLNTKNVELAALLYERPGGDIKVSFRSRGINVSRIAVSLGGGGHKTAAGCNLHKGIEDATEQVISLLKQALADE